MSTIRPPSPPQTPPQAPRLSGQSALFALARGRVADTAAAMPTAQTPPLNRTAEAAADPRQKILRPGSLLDIRI